MHFCCRSGLRWSRLDRNRTKLQASVQRCSDPAYHRQCMTLVVGILKATDHRGRRPNTLGKLSLAESCLRSHVVDQLRRFNVDEFLFKVGLPPPVVADDFLISYLERFRLKSFLGSHNHYHQHPQGMKYPVSLSLERMGLWVGFKPPFSFGCPDDLHSRDLAFLLQPMRDHSVLA